MVKRILAADSGACLIGRQDRMNALWMYFVSGAATDRSVDWALTPLLDGDTETSSSEKGHGVRVPHKHQIMKSNSPWAWA